MWYKNNLLKLADVLCFDVSKIQHIIDADKYVLGEKNSCDPCGNYAPFCAVCTKWAFNPCSTAYRISERSRLIPLFIESTGAEDVRAVQTVVDLDKYIASEAFGVDLCGRYAPFCSVCDKTQPFPCGEAYFRLKTAENFSTTALVAQEGGILAINAPRWDEALVQVLESEDESVVHTESGPRRIRIGIARRRTAV